jgi:hypothetical protein
MLHSREGGGFVIGKIENVFETGNYKNAPCYRGYVAKDEPAPLLV